MIAKLALVAAVARLRDAGIEAPAGDARALLAHAMQIAPERLSLQIGEVLSPAQQARFEAAISARQTRQPVSQIIGHRLFFGRRFTVTPDTLDPRPETEALILAALGAPFSRVLDLGTGTGAILLSLLAERPGATGLASDLSPAALAVARQNALALGLGERAEFRLSDWYQAISGQFDLIVSNPPYIALDEMEGLEPEVRGHEPHLALTDFADGLSAYRLIAAGAPAHLHPGGRLIVEIGPSQGRAVAGFFSAAGFEAVRVLPDLDGRDRLVTGDWPGCDISRPLA